MWWYRLRPRRWLMERCSSCSQRFGYRESHFANGNRDGQVFHQNCLGALTWRCKAEERLTVVGVMAALSGLTSGDIEAVLGGRLPEHEAHNGRNQAWRVFHDLEKSRRIAPTTPEATS